VVKGSWKPLSAGLRGRWPTLALVTGLLIWLWPIGVGGRMPVGGDVTAFQIGLMAEYQRALHGFRLPLWNANWGYGFPGLAESQMGVYYPPHVVLYELLPLEAAYTASLVLHTLWSGLGASWAARRFGASRGASALAGFVWAASGFFLIHITHQWAYTAGSWMPWAWGLAWMLARGQGTRRTWLVLAAVLALQVLPGHFQLAFITQATVLVMTFWGLIDRGRDVGGVGGEPDVVRPPTPALPHAGGGGKILDMPRRHAPRVRWGGLAVLLAWMAAGFLTACQLAPTWELARRADTQRTHEYLSGFATSPFHLVSYVAPGLFHRSPLWRPLAWDPFHTSPEEHLGYVGLVPLWLALACLWREGCRDPRVRTLGVVGLVTLLLSFGPYVPGFRELCEVPGFSFFRAPARWGSATMLALALLAALGFDRLTAWARVRASLLRFVGVALLISGLTVATVELAFASTSGRSLPGVADGFERLRQALPWSGDPSFREVMSAARRPATNPIIHAGLGRQGIDPGARLDRERGRIYAQELGETAALLAALVLLAAFTHRFLSLRPREVPSPPRGGGLGRGGRDQGSPPTPPVPVPGTSDEHASPQDTLKTRSLRAGLVAVTALDLLLLGRHRDVDTGPIRSLVEQSPVLQRLAEEARTTRGRVVSPLGNLPLVANASALPAYRTLDVPAVPQLAPGILLDLRIGDEEYLEWAARGMQISGVAVAVQGPTSGEVPSVALTTEVGLRRESVEDSLLSGWLTGAPPALEAGPARGRFSLFHCTWPTSRAWLLEMGTNGAGAWNPSALTASFVIHSGITAEGWNRIPLPWSSDVPERLTVEMPHESGAGSWVIVTQLHDPGWCGEWVDPDGTRAATVVPAFRTLPASSGGWQAIKVPGPGRWTLRLWYEGRAAWRGLAASGVAWAVWTGLWIAPWRWIRRRTEGGSARSESAK
jgi:hypothetical protein